MPTPDDQKTAKIVVGLLERSHMAKPKIDDATAVKWCKNFLKDLDPQKYYFEKADVDEFMAQATTLDDKIKEGNLDFAKLVFDRFLKRSDERLATVNELLKQKPDFTVDESIVDDPDKLDYPADAAEAKERMAEADQARPAPAQGRQDRGRRGPQEAGDPLSRPEPDGPPVQHVGAARGLPQQPDPDVRPALELHGARRSRTLIQQLHLSLTGIGASLQSEDGFAVVKEIVPGMAADKDGRLQPEDKIVGIQKEDGDRDRPRREEAQRRRPLHPRRRRDPGPPDRPAAGTKDRKIYELTRQKIELTRAARQGAGHRDQGRGRQDAQGRRDQPAGVLRRHPGRPQGRGRRGELHALRWR